MAMIRYRRSESITHAKLKRNTRFELTPLLIRCHHNVVNFKHDN